MSVSELEAYAGSLVGQGRLPSCQFAVAKGGSLVAVRSFGGASSSTRYLIYSATKPIVASAVWVLLGRGLVELDAPVTTYIPEFGANGKDRVTVEQVLLHTCGFPNAVMEPRFWSDRPARLDRISSWILEYEPGERFVYHGNSAHWVLAELIERMAGVRYQAFVREEIFARLGLADSYLGMPVDEQERSDVPLVVQVGERCGERDILRVKGVRTLPSPDIVDANFLQYNDEEIRAIGTPSSGVITSAASLALLYQEMMRNDHRLWADDVLTDATETVRNSHPVDGLGVSANRSAGLLLAGEGQTHFRHLFGDGPSPGAFGHTGAAGQISWADPASGLSFVFLTHALDADVLRQWRVQRRLCDLAAALAGEAVDVRR